MRVRLLFAVVILFALTAFAPAPLPKRTRTAEPPACSLAALQGTWRIVDGKVAQGVGKFVPYDTKPNVRVRLSGNTWTFLVDGRGNDMIVAIDHTKSPAHLTFYQKSAPNTPFGVGLVRRVGNQIQILYKWHSVRPASFETAPDGFWLRSLERESEAPR